MAIPERLTTLAKNKDMNKFTDDFFSFPIKIYDGFSAKKAMEAEDKDTTDEPVPIDWIVGWARIPAKELSKIMWHDGFSRERKVEEVAKNGFDTTMIFNDLYGDFVCTWPRKKFEEKLNEFMEKRQQPIRQVNLPFVYVEPLPYSVTTPGDEFTTTSSTDTSPDLGSPK